MSNAFFYWTALPADDADLLLSFDQWLVEAGADLVRIEEFVSEVPTMTNGFAPAKKNAFIVVSTPEDILNPEGAFLGLKLHPATESTTMKPLGQLPFEEADKARLYRLTVKTDEEAAGSWQSDRDLSMMGERAKQFEEERKKSSQRTVAVSVVVLIGCIAYIVATKNGRKRL